MRNKLLILSIFTATFSVYSQEEREIPPPPVEINEEEEPKAVVPIPPPVVIEKVGVREAEVIDFPDKEASFPGGQDAYLAYIDSNMVYPKAALVNGIEGRVYLSFVVEPNGKITNVMIERGALKELDVEAKRLVRGMPNWVPGEAGGKKMRTRNRVVVVFTL